MLLKSLMKAAFFRMSRGLGVNRCLRWLHRSDLLVVCYHGVVGDDHPADRFRYRNTVTVGEFDEQLKAMSRMFRPLSAGDLIAALERGRPLPERSLLITFDDGFRNNLTRAAPVLERHGIPAVFHVTTGHIGTDRLLWPQEVVEAVLRWPRTTIPLVDGGESEVPDTEGGRIALADKIRNACKKVPNARRLEYLERLLAESPGVAGEHKELYEFMNWQEVRDLHRKGFEIGSHTIHHPILSRLDADELTAELRESKERIEAETGAECRVIAYPNGGADDISAQVLASVEAAGYRLGLTLIPSFNEPPPVPLEVRRVPIVGQTPAHVFHSRVSGLLSLLRRPS